MIHPLTSILSARARGTGGGGKSTNCEMKIKMSMSETILRLVFLAEVFGRNMTELHRMLLLRNDTQL